MLAALSFDDADTARAQDTAPVFRDIETKYVFGFTEGSGIGLEGEREVSFDTEARIGKRDGHYFAQREQARIRVHAQPIRAVRVRSLRLRAPASATSPISTTAISSPSAALFGEVRYLLLDRGPSSPLGVTLSAEPEWRRIDETSGERVNNVELEMKLNADLELVPQRLYLGANLLYEPEGTHDPDRVGAGWAMEVEGRRLRRARLSRRARAADRRRGLVSAPL